MTKINTRHFVILTTKKFIGEIKSYKLKLSDLKILFSKDSLKYDFFIRTDDGRADQSYIVAELLKIYLITLSNGL